MDARTAVGLMAIQNHYDELDEVEEKRKEEERYADDDVENSDGDEGLPKFTPPPFSVKLKISNEDVGKLFNFLGLRIPESKK